MVLLQYVIYGSANEQYNIYRALYYRFEDWAFSFSPLSCINEYLAIDSGGNVSDLALARNCCLARMLPGEAELVSE